MTPALSLLLLVCGIRLQGSAAPNKPAAAAAAAAASSRLKAGAGSSLLAEKMADMARKAPPSKPRSPDGMVERKAAWGKTGIIALRDLQLTAVEPGWLEGEQGPSTPRHIWGSMLHGHFRQTTMALHTYTYTACVGFGCSVPHLCTQKLGDLGVLEQRGFGRRVTTWFVTLSGLGQQCCLQLIKRRGNSRSTASCWHTNWRLKL